MAPVWKIHIDEELEIELPLMELGNGFISIPLI